MAGGRGERARGATQETPKQFRPLGGRALVARSYDLLIDAGCSPVIVVVAPDLFELARTLLPPEVVLAPGRASRAGSVASGLERVSSERVVIHDAVRPFAPPQLVRSVVAALADADGAIAAIPVEETLKQVEDDRVVETVDRAGVWRAQTPQAFRTGAIRAAHEWANQNGVTVTDDAQLLEHAGRRVVVVPGSRTNLKITFPEDFAVAECFLRARVIA